MDFRQMVEDALNYGESPKILLWGCKEWPEHGTEEWLRRVFNTPALSKAEDAIIASMAAQYRASVGDLFIMRS